MRAIDWSRVAVVSFVISVTCSACGGRLEVADCGPDKDFCASSKVCCPHGYACGTGANGCPSGGCCAATASRLIDSGIDAQDDAGDDATPFGFGALPTPAGAQGAGTPGSSAGSAGAR
jgi:hypothetical protein